MKILICGLPGSGKTTLAKSLAKLLNAKLLNADEVRTQNNDWDFSEDGRVRQAQRMRELADAIVYTGETVIADFICPTKKTREEFNADYTIWMDTIKEGRYEDTNVMFEKLKEKEYDWLVGEWNDNTHELLFPGIKREMAYHQTCHLYRKWSSLSNPDCWCDRNGRDSFETKDDNGKIIGFEQYNNDYLSRSEINEETLSKKHVLFLGDSFIYGHGVKREDNLASQFKNNIKRQTEYSCFNLGYPGGNNTLSLLRLQQWCNVHSDQIDTVYFCLTDIAREIYWELENNDWSWDDNMYEQTDANEPFLYIPSRPRRIRYKKQQQAFENMTSKINYLAKLEVILISVINMSRIHGFNLFFFDTFQNLLTPQERNIITKIIPTQKNIIWGEPDYRTGSIIEDIISKDDSHWNATGTKKIADKLYENTKEWYI